MRFDLYKFVRQIINFLHNKPTVKIDELPDYCFSTNLSLKEIRNEFKDRGWELNHTLQHTIETRYGKQLLTARKLDYKGHQYHARIFKDEDDNDYRVYCHYEWAPETRPYEHYMGEGCEKNCEKIGFLKEVNNYADRIKICC